MSTKPFEAVPGLPPVTEFMTDRAQGNPADLKMKEGDYIFHEPVEVTQNRFRRHGEARDKRIKEKYQKLVDRGLYENCDMRSFPLGLATAIVHFKDKAIYVMTYPIISATPAAFIKTCACGAVMYKEMDRDIHEPSVDIERVLDGIAQVLDFDGDKPTTGIELSGRNPELHYDSPNTDFDGDPDVPNPHAKPSESGPADLGADFPG
jgi:hypothetical protein